MRYLIITVFVCFVFVSQAQQRPFINTISKTTGTIGESISISGSGFTNNCRVFFGAGEATYTLNSSTLITAIVPTNATLGPVRIVDTNTGLYGSSSSQFYLSFDGSTFSTANFDSRLDFTTNNQLSTDLCACDFNGDGKNDIAISNEDNTQVNIFTNTSSGTTVSFSNQSFNNQNTETTISACGDLNGDGRAEILFTASLATDLNHIFIYENTSSTSTINLSLADQFTLPNKVDGTGRNLSRRLKIADIDGDGINDIIISSVAEASVFVYRNTNATTINIANDPYRINIAAVSRFGGLDVSDLNNDGLPDVIAIPFDISTERIYALRNASTSGEVRLVLDTTFASPGSRQNVALGDFNNDGMIDIATTDRDIGRIYINQNTSSLGGKLSFSNEQFFTASDVWGLDIGDVNGDGLLDVVAASTDNSIFFLINNRTDNTISFESPTSITTASRNRNIEITDLNNDGKVDLAFTHRSISNTIGDLSVLTNRHCTTPKITPENLTFCLNSPFTLEATKTANATYTWNVTSGNGTVVNNGDNATFTATSGTNISVSVTITSTDGACTRTTSETFSMTNGSPPSAPAITKSNNANPLCAGADLTLSAPAADNYFWILPDGTLSSQQSITLTNVTSNNSGLYQLRVQTGSGCVSDPNELNLNVDQPPTIAISNNGSDDFCATGGSTELQVPNYDGFSYQWSNSSGNIGSATNNTYTATASGNYTATITSNTSNCTFSSVQYNVNAVPVPASIIDAESEICVDVPLALTAASTGAAGFTLNYSWDFGDGTSSTDQAPSKTWASSATVTVGLTTGYDEITNCAQTMTQNITVAAIPNIAITSASGTFVKCPSDSIRLELPQGYQSYNWSTGDTDFFTYAKTERGVSDVNITASMVTNIGCPVTSEETVSNFPNSGVIFTSTEAEIQGDSIQLSEEQISVLVTAEVDGGSDYLWSPEELLDITDGPTVRIFPSRRFNDISVSVTDINNCRETASIRVLNQGIIARKSFSPNGDGMGFDCWEILNTTNLQGCKVYVFDSRGRNVFVGDSPFPDNCVWNGNVEGGNAQAPEGIYYFVMKCDESDFDQSGSILLGR